MEAMSGHVREKLVVLPEITKKVRSKLRRRMEVKCIPCYLRKDECTWMPPLHSFLHSTLPSHTTFVFPQTPVLMKPSLGLVKALNSSHCTCR